MLDRQAMAVPSRHIGGVEAGHRFRFDDDVFQNLVERMADMDAAVGVGRAIVQEIAGPALAGFLNARIQAFLLPPGEQFRLPLRQIGLHRKIGFRQIESRLVVHTYNRFGRK